jgi:hypothetical protein
MTRSLIFALVALLFGCGMTMIGFVATGAIGNVAMAPGATISFWLYSGRVHESGYAFGAIVLNCLVYSALAYLCIRLFIAARSGAHRKKGVTSR